jgi:hypothetical protein
MNPLENQGLTLSNGNLDVAYTPEAWKSAKSTFSMTSGKWYFEATPLQTWSNGMLGVYPTSSALASDGLINNAYAYQTDGRIWNNKTVLTTTSSFSSGDTIMCAIDIDAGKLWFGRNGTWYNSGAPASGTNATYTGLSGAYSPATSIYNGSSGFATNFGQRAFAYTAPSGFKALCTQNLPTPTIGATSTTQANDYFNVLLYNGSATSQNITGVGFSPDLVWIKTRSNAESHQLVDQVRGATKALMSNEQSAETIWTNGLSAFLSDGFTLPGGNNRYSDTGYTYVAWNWNAGGSTVTNTTGSISAQVRASTTSGFSIVTYTGNGSTGTVGHGLGVAPKFIITKYRNAINAWQCYHASIGAGYRLFLNQTNAQTANSTVWNNTAPTSSVFSVGDANTNASGGTYVAYCFSEVPGYSAFGSYTGNGAADGPFVFTNFRPRFVMIKISSSTGNWVIIDTARGTYNAIGPRLYADLSDAEYTADRYDILSNGFKIRTTSGESNSSGGTYIYMALAENPFKYSLGR